MYHHRRLDYVSLSEISCQCCTLPPPVHGVAVCLCPCWQELRHAMLRAQRVASEAREDAAAGRTTDEEEVGTLLLRTPVLPFDPSSCVPRPLPPLRPFLGPRLVIYWCVVFSVIFMARSDLRCRLTGLYSCGGWFVGGAFCELLYFCSAWDFLSIFFSPSLP